MTILLAAFCGVARQYPACPFRVKVEAATLAASALRAVRRPADIAEAWGLASIAVGLRNLQFPNSMLVEY